MNPRIVKEHVPILNPNDIEVSENIINALSMTTQQDWDSFFNSLRLNVQSRILGSSRDDLVKIQARVEQIEDERAFFKRLFTTPKQP